MPRANHGQGHFALESLEPRQLLTIIVEPVTTHTTRGGTDAVAFDADRDGDLDLAVVNPSDSTIAIFFNDGAGRFAGSILATGAPRDLSAITAADLDGDGDADLALTGDSGLVIVRNDGGAFTPLPRRAEFSGDVIAAADLDLDGRSDLVIGSATGGTSRKILVLYGNGALGIRASEIFTVNELVTDLALADITGDGRLDIIVGFTANNGTIEPGDHRPIPILINQTRLAGAGFRVTTTVNGNGAALDVARSPAGIAAGDMDRDGDQDLVILSEGDVEGLIVLFNNGSGRFTTSARYETRDQSTFVRLGDLDGDGALDVITSSRRVQLLESKDVFRVLANNGAGVLTPAFTNTDSDYRGRIVAADLTRDGLPEIVVADSRHNRIVLFDNRSPARVNTNLAPGSAVSPAAAPNGSLIAGVRNADGRSIAFERSPGRLTSWTARDITRTSGAPAGETGAVTWNDPKDGRFYALTRAGAAAGGGRAIFLHVLDGEFWTSRDLTQELAGNPGLDRDPAVLIGVDGLVRLASISASGDLLLLEQFRTGNLGTGPIGWRLTNITQRDLLPAGMTMPVFADPRAITTYVTSWNGLNVAGLDAAGQIHTIWWAPGVENDRWQTTNLSQITGAPPLAGGLAPYLTPWGGINLAGLNADGQVVVTWWVPQFGGHWEQNNLTAETAGTPLAGRMTSYVTPWGGLNLVGLDAAGRAVVYWWAPASNVWAVTPLSTQAGLNQPLASVTGITSPTGEISVFAVTAANNHLWRLHWRPGEAWLAQDLTAIAAS